MRTHHDIAISYELHRPRVVMVMGNQRNRFANLTVESTRHAVLSKERKEHKLKWPEETFSILGKKKDNLKAESFGFSLLRKPLKTMKSTVGKIEVKVRDKTVTRFPTSKIKIKPLRKATTKEVG